jgi:hypothetical protein
MIGKRWNIFYGYASRTTAWIVIATSCDAQMQTLFKLTPGESGCKIFPKRWMDLEVQLQG